MDTKMFHLNRKNKKTYFIDHFLLGIKMKSKSRMQVKGLTLD